MSLEDPAPVARSWVRRWFRARLDHEPRRWVLFLAAVEGLVTYGWELADWELAHRAPPAKLEAVWTVLGAVGLALAPLSALVVLVVHCRLLHWSGRVLGGRARPLELHAAAAWAAVPIVLTGWPAVLRVGLRLARLDREGVPAWLQAATDLADSLARTSHSLTAVAILATAPLYVIFLAEAQRFTKVRAVLNHLLAALLLLALLAGGIALGWALGNHRAVGLPVLTCVAIALVAWRVLAARRDPAPYRGVR
jgi:hypothetical protein